MFAFIDYVDFQFHVVASESVWFHEQLKPVETKKKKQKKKKTEKKQMTLDSHKEGNTRHITA